MIRQSRVLPEAESDVLDAYRWYEERTEGLGSEFLRAVDACLAFIKRNPLAYRQVHKDVRRALLRKFPYGLFYVVESDEIVVLACFHVRRDPRQIPDRR